MYTLIAFKPEKENWICGYVHITSSQLIRFDGLSEEQCVQTIVDLSNENKNSTKFTEFHIIPITWTKTISESIEIVLEKVNKINNSKLCTATTT